MKGTSRFGGNAAFGLVGGAIFLATMLAGRYLLDNRTGTTIGLLGFAVCFLFIGSAPLVTGYSWKNLADRNQGPHRSEQPREYWASVLLPLAASVLACWLAFRYYERH